MLTVDYLETIKIVILVEGIRGRLMKLILFENLFKLRQLYLQPQGSALSNLRLAS